MPMQMAMLLAALCSCSSASAFQLPPPRTSRFGFQPGYSRVQQSSFAFQQQRAAVEGARSTIGGRSLYGTNVGSSGSEEIEVRLRQVWRTNAASFVQKKEKSDTGTRYNNIGF